MLIEPLQLLNLLGALGLFLYGMEVMSDALMRLAGDRMRTLMAQLTANRFSAMLTGLLITGLIQSSSATTLMVVSFVNAGLLRLTEAIGVIMGANIGTTLTAWLITVLGFKVSMSAIALPLVMLGFVFYLRKRDELRQWGRLLIGFALLFLGLEFMKEAVPDLQSSTELLTLIRDLNGHGFLSTLLFVGIGTGLTLILQSSSATMAITLVAASQGLLPFEAATAIVLGENIGTTVTANLAALIAGTHARRAALAHLMFNLIGVCWVLMLMPWVLEAVESMANTQGASPMKEATDIPLGLALFHSSFNILNMLLLIGFVPQLARLVSGLLPGREAPRPAPVDTLHLKSEFLKYPETALAALLQETRRLYRLPVFEALAHGIHLHREDLLGERPAAELVLEARTPMSLELGRFIEQRVQPIYTAVVEYAARSQAQLTLSDSQQQELEVIKHANRDVLDILTHLTTLNHHVTLYLNDPNLKIRQEFDRLRIQLVMLIRGIVRIYAEHPVGERDAPLEGLWHQIQADDDRLLKEIDVLIRHSEITPEMGAALISASASLRHMCKDLIKGALRLGGTGQAYESLEQQLFPVTQVRSHTA